jgi:HEAT repeat protein
MPGKRKFEEQLAALDALRKLESEERVAGLRQALANKNNFLVSKAADLVREFHHMELIPELLAAYAHCFGDQNQDNAGKVDPQCWAKNAISRALAAFEYQEPDVFLRGMKHIQLEPVYGGMADSAATLRSTCALALVQCREVRELDLLNHLVELFADKDKSVRADAARAVEQVRSSSAALLLRLRAVLASDEPEVLGACYGGVLRLEGASAIPWVSRFLAEGDDAAAEAALAISATHSPEAFEALRECLEHQTLHTADPWFTSALLSAIALTRQEAAMEFLLGLVKKESRHAEAAIEAICRSMPSEEKMKRLEGSVEGSPRLTKVLVTHRSTR